MELMSWSNWSDPTASAEAVSVRALRASGVDIEDGPNAATDLAPGDIVWAWVPFGTHAGGKDRPCVIIASETGAAAVLMVALTSRERDTDPDYLFLGYGEWNPDGPASWARVNRLYRIGVRDIRQRSPHSVHRQQLRALRTVLRIPGSR